MDSLESFANAAIGTLISIAVTHWVLGYAPGESVTITAMFFGLSYARAAPAGHFQEAWMTGEEGNMADA